MKIPLVIVILAAAASCAAGAPDEDLWLFLELFPGQFDNRAQTAAEAGVEGAEPLPEEERHPWHHHTTERVSAPELGEHVFLARINEQGPDGPLVRARVFVVEGDPAGGAILQRFFAIEGESVASGAAAPLDPATLRAYPDGCRVVWRRHGDGFAGEIPKGDCRVVSPRSGRTIVIAARMELDRARLRHLEEGFDETMQPLFGPPGGRPFELDRVVGD